MRLSSLFSFVAGAALIPQAYAWGAVGHEIVATVAQMHLHPSVLPKLCAVLNVPDAQCHLAPVAAWADRIRQLPKYRWTGPLHYINALDDYPSATCLFPGPQGWAGRTHINVLSGVRNVTTVLRAFEMRRAGGARSRVFVDDPDREDAPDYVQDALRFLIHFIGDMHQPLHLAGRDRGGNQDKVAFDGRTTNLHTVWDSLLISERLRTLPHNYTRPLPLPDVESHLRDAIYDPYVRRLVWEGVLGRWQDELEAWVDCPATLAAAPRPTSAWQTVLSLLSSARDEDGDDGGLSVDDADLCPYAWAKPIHELNCEIVFPKELDDLAFQDEDDADALARKSHYLELYTPEYAGVIKERWIVEKLLTQGGVRLAAVLNWIFADVAKDELVGSYPTL